jgi:hypothetical protein
MQINKRFYVYLYRDPRPGMNNCPRYVGKGSGRRAYQHLTDIARTNLDVSLFMTECKKLGLTPELEIVGTFATEEEALRFEIKRIARYGRVDLGTGTLFNRTDGGRGVIGRGAARQDRICPDRQNRGAAGRQKEHAPRRFGPLAALPRSDEESDRWRVSAQASRVARHHRALHCRWEDRDSALHA